MKRVYIVSGLVVVVSVLVLIVFNRLASEKKTAALFTEVFNGDFEINVTSAGELRAENSVEIKGPEIAQRGDVRSQDIRIQDLVPEGTEVQAGDYVAQLDRSNFENTLKDIQEFLATAQKNLEMKILDTAVTLSAIRNDVQNQRYIVEADSITFRNSKFEPPTTQRQAEINFDQAKRTLGQRERRYTLSVAYAKFEIENLRWRERRISRRMNDYEEILSNFTVKAPSAGMIIYKRDWRGNKRKTGSQINPFDRVIATLPDLSSMMSRILVTEIDIAKLKPGKKANVVVDAFPHKAFNGVVSTVANIGEKLPNTDSKVFEVLIKIDGTDPLLRPSMTTGNKVIIETYSNVTQVPIECVQAESDSIPFVYTKNKMKQIVLLGQANEKNVIIEKGLEPGETIYLATPENPEKFKISGKDLIPVIKARDKAKIAEFEKYRTIAEPVKMEKPLTDSTALVLVK
jgi:HlyD family secretion protein